MFIQKKGTEFIQKNYDAIDLGDRVEEIEVNPAWKHLELIMKEMKLTTFMQKIMNPINSLHGNEIPVSAFKGYEDGTFMPGSSALEKKKYCNYGATLET